MMASQAESSEYTFQEALKQHLPLIQVAPTEAERRQTATAILDAMSVYVGRSHPQQCPKNLNGVREAFAVLFSELGPGDSQIRGVLLALLDSTEHAETRQLLLDVLPSVILPEDDERVTEQVLTTLRRVTNKDSTALIPVLGCLSSLPLTEAGASRIFAGCRQCFTSCT